MQGREASVQTSLQAIADKAASQPGYRFRNLYGMLNEKMLKDSWQHIRKDAAYGVDRVSAEDYEQNLGENIRQLVEGLKQKRYRAKLVLRRYIPKGNGKFRPLGIPATQDKLLQLAVKRHLEAIYEQDFLRCSYGYRPNIGALDAVDKLTVKLQFGKYNYVVEADIKGFFDHLDHDWLLKMLAERIDDKALLWLIKKWLKAGVLDTNGKVLHPATGTPQGGIISPILANVYLHYALDLWFQKVVVPHCGGEACLIRYADDFVCAFEKQVDAQRFYEVLGKRLGKFGLELPEEKTRVIPFSPISRPGKTSFDFLGFEFRWGKDRAGKPHVKRRTARKNLRSSLKRFNEWCKKNRHLRLPELFKQLNAKLRGYFNYYGVNGNFFSLTLLFYKVMKLLMKYLNQRSQRGSYNWAGFIQLIDQFGIVKPRITRRPKRYNRMSSAPTMA
ncbi:MAG: group II intron reverse transcriptase/maturase [Anaerolineales bacterium]|nr:group II intron reverse transcriptase/maturase [Anaerolineales bacterium]